MLLYFRSVMFKPRPRRRSSPPPREGTPPSARAAGAASGAGAPSARGGPARPLPRGAARRGRRLGAPGRRRGVARRCPFGRLFAVRLFDRVVLNEGLTPGGAFVR